LIYPALQHIVLELNTYFKLISPSSGEERVVVGTLFDLDGQVNNATKGKVVVSVVNVEEEGIYRSVDLYRKRDDGVSALVKPEVRINLYVLFVANLSNYEEVLKAISQIISFFQLKPSFDYSDIPLLAEREGRISVELFSMTFEQQNHLWGALGGKYMPSVMYKIGIVGIRDEQIEEEIPPVEERVINASLE
jgi:hypothetical protein